MLADLLVALRRAIFLPPADPNARAWHVYDDGFSDFRLERRWDDARHRWATRTVTFEGAEELQRALEGRLSQEDIAI